MTPLAYEVISGSERQTIELGKKIAKACSSGAVVSLRGPLGSGKTILVKGIAEALGIDEAIISPSFTLVQEYEGTVPLHHLDLYRIDDNEEFESIGGEELLYNDGITVIEWGEKIETLLPSHTVFVTIEIIDNESRRITVKGIQACA